MITERMRRRRQAQLVRPPMSTSLRSDYFFPLLRRSGPQLTWCISGGVGTKSGCVVVQSLLWLCGSVLVLLVWTVSVLISMSRRSPRLASPWPINAKATTQPASHRTQPPSQSQLLSHRLPSPTPPLLLLLSRGAPTGQTQATDRSIRRRPVAPNQGQVGGRAPGGRMNLWEDWMGMRGCILHILYEYSVGEVVAQSNASG